MRQRGRAEHTSTTKIWFLASACLVTLGVLGARAEGRDPFAHADLVDPIGVARLADEAGDFALREALTQAAQRERALSAVRAAVYAHAPEELIAPLLPLAIGRDPVLAPEAAMALLQIGQRLTPTELSTREALLSTLKEASQATRAALDEARSPRADIRLALSVLQAQLTDLERQLGPAP
jgi:hypothetical protein